MDTKDAKHEAMIEGFWRDYFIEGPPQSQISKQKFFKLLPAEHRCKFCFAPFDGVAAPIVKNVLKTQQSRYNPHYCNTCDTFSKKFQGGANVPVTILFADMRGSTTIAENMDPKEFSKLVNRFYITATRVLTNSGAMIEKLVGDEVTAIFSRGLAGEDYIAKAIRSAEELLRETGHGGKYQPWAPIGIGINSGETYLGSVGNPDGMIEVAALGDVPNTASRLTSMAGQGEIMVSETTILDAKRSTEGLEKRTMALKGKEGEITAYVIDCN